MSRTPYDARYTEYQLSRNWLRRIVRSFFLDRALEKVEGPTLDVGCGVGDLLSRLPLGSAGLEYNKATIEFCLARGLNVAYYDGESDGWALSPIKQGKFTSLSICHVLEHLKSPETVLNHLLRASEAKGISRVLVVVPDYKGYLADKTHVEFVDLLTLSQNAIVEGTDFRVTSADYFPFPFSSIGRYFRYQELQVTYSLRD